MFQATGKLRGVERLALPQPIPSLNGRNKTVPRMLMSCLTRKTSQCFVRDAEVVDGMCLDLAQDSFQDDQGFIVRKIGTPGYVGNVPWYWACRANHSGL
jgi:hypothetical protein|tara:strand:- start:30612 stop:30908 length:297 start_codon:yes stop_codon:yes gene_type:complete